MAEHTDTGAPCTSCGSVTTTMGVHYTAAGVDLLCAACDDESAGGGTRLCAVDNITSAATANRLRAGVFRLVRTIDIAQARPQG